jgi:hypothetical protein
MSNILENKEDEYLNQITLKYLTNFDYHNECQDMTQREKNNIFNGKHYKKIYKNKEKKFYKKRIMNIIKLLMNDDSREKREKPITDNGEIAEINEEENSELFFPDIKTTFDIFIRTCIDYLKAQDKCDIIQDDYKNLEMHDGHSYESNNDNIDQNAFNKQINGLMMRKILKKKNFIDSFVKRTPIELNIQNSVEQINKIIPHKKKINLHDPELKTKGLIISQNNLDDVINKNLDENKNNIIYKEEIVNIKNDKYQEKCEEKNKKKQKKSDKKVSKNKDNTN